MKTYRVSFAFDVPESFTSSEIITLTTNNVIDACNWPITDIHIEVDPPVTVDEHGPYCDSISFRAFDRLGCGLFAGHAGEHEYVRGLGSITFKP